MAYLIEETKGRFPTWLAPVQVKVLPISEKTHEYANAAYNRLRTMGVRAQIDDRSETIGYKIREARQVDRVPYMLVIGEKEVEAGLVAVRDRATDKTQTMTMDEFCDMLAKEIAERA